MSNNRSDEDENSYFNKLGRRLKQEFSPSTLKEELKGNIGIDLALSLLPAGRAMKVGAKLGSKVASPLAKRFITGLTAGTASEALPAVKDVALSEGSLSDRVRLRLPSVTGGVAQTATDTLLYNKAGVLGAKTGIPLTLLAGAGRAVASGASRGAGFALGETATGADAGDPLLEALFGGLVQAGTNVATGTGQFLQRRGTVTKGIREAGERHEKRLGLLDEEYEGHLERGISLKERSDVAEHSKLEAEDELSILKNQETDLADRSLVKTQQIAQAREDLSDYSAYVKDYTKGEVGKKEREIQKARQEANRVIDLINSDISRNKAEIGKSVSDFLRDFGHYADNSTNTILQMRANEIDKQTLSAPNYARSLNEETLTLSRKAVASLKTAKDNLGTVYDKVRRIGEKLPVNLSQDDINALEQFKFAYKVQKNLDEDMALNTTQSDPIKQPELIVADSMEEGVPKAIGPEKWMKLQTKTLKT